MSARAADGGRPERDAEILAALEADLTAPVRVRPRRPVGAPVRVAGLRRPVPPPPVVDERQGDEVTPVPSPEVSEIDEPRWTWRARLFAHRIRHHGQMSSLLAAGDPRDWTADVRLDRAERAAERELRAHELKVRADLVAVRADAARRRLVALLVVAMIGGLSWSTVTVHAGFTHGERPWSPAWLIGWLIEPALACVLIGGIVAMQTARRLGIRVSDETRSRFTKIEFAAFSVTAILSLYPLIDGDEPITIGSVAHHVVGALIAILAAVSLGAANALFDAQPPVSRGVTPPSYRHDAAASVTPVAPRRPAPGSLDEGVARVRAALAARVITAPSAAQIRTLLGGGMDRARAIRDAIEAADR